MATTKTKSPAKRKTSASGTTKSATKRKKVSKTKLKKLLAGAAWGHMFGKDPRSVPRFYGGPQEIARSSPTRTSFSSRSSGSSSGGGVNRARSGKGKTGL